MRGFKSFKVISFWIALVVSIGLCAWIFAEQPDTANSPSLKTAGPVSRVAQQITGFTPISGWVANRVLHRELARYVKGHLHSHLSLFSGTDLIGGKARAVSLSGKHIVLNGFIPVSEFTFASQPDTPIFLSKTSHPILLRPVTFHFAMTLTEDDINRMLSSDEGHRMLTDMRVKLPPFGQQSFDAINPVVHLENDLVTINALMNLHHAPTGNAIPMTVSGRVVPAQSSLALSDLDLNIEGVSNTQDLAQVVEHYFNELVDLNHIKVQRHKVKVQIEQSQVSKGQMSLKATMIVSPDPKALKAALSDPAS